MSVLRTFRRQLHTTSLIRLVGAEGIRRLVNPAATSSYAQAGEDIVIASLLSWPRSGFYVDVGCHHPIRLSNTYLLYLRGSMGICIDANIEFGPLFARLRPRDKFIAACVGDSVGEVEFTVFKDRALSSVGGRRVTSIAAHQYEIDHVERAPIRPLAEILDEHGAPPEFELLSIDVEGHDFSVLKSAALDRYRPKLIVIEMHGVDVGRTAEHEVSIYLADHGYFPVAIQCSNVFFLQS
jgi:FkbM family methyltransferase